jgi:predicted transcriptional regulator
MFDNHSESQPIILPDDLMDAVKELSEKLSESPRDIIIAAVDHFTRLPEERRKAIMIGTSMRRRN